VRPRAKRRLQLAWQYLRAAVTFGRYAIPDDRVREVLTRAEGVANALDPHEEQLRRDYGVDPDVPRGTR
jgi:hypothetical protein